MANTNVRKLQKITVPANTDDHTLTFLPSVNKNPFKVVIDLVGTGTIDFSTDVTVAGAELRLVNTGVTHLELLMRPGEVLHYRGTVGSEVFQVSIG